MRALQRENGVAVQRTADLHERLNFQCFKYELLVDMVGGLLWSLINSAHALPCPGSQTCWQLTTGACTMQSPAVKQAHIAYVCSVLKRFMECSRPHITLLISGSRCLLSRTVAWCNFMSTLLALSVRSAAVGHAGAGQ